MQRTALRYVGCALFAALSFLGQQATPAGDWPSWRGPDRTGVSAETGLLKTWPKDGPSLVWKAAGLGGGYSTPSVAGGRVFLLGSKDKEEYLHALNAADGASLWSIKIGAVGRNSGPQYPGPRCAPTVDGDRVYVLGSDGDLVCTMAESGKETWRKHFIKDFKGNRPAWAYAESPLVDGDVLVCTPGGPTATLVALHKQTGSLIWQTHTGEPSQAGYTGPVVAEFDGVRQYVQFLGSGLISVAARDGKLLWTYDKHLGGVSAGTPVVHDGCVFSSASGVEGSAGGDALIRPTRQGGKWHVQQIYLVRNMVNFHGGVVCIGDSLYGAGGSGLVCLDFKTGERKWQARSVGQGSLLAADGHLYYRGQRGEMALVEAAPAGYHEKGRFQQPERSRFATFCHPVLANGRLYLRDENILLCYDVKAK